MKPILLIDGDILVYKMAYSVETPIYVCKNAIYKRKGYAEAQSLINGFPVTKRVNIGSEQELKKKLNDQMAQIFDDMCCHDYKMYITSTHIEANFRDKVATILPYKENRVKTPKPIHYRRMRKMLIEEWGAIEVHGQEADDALAIEQTRIAKESGDLEHSTIVSIDKDLMQIPGQHYHINDRKERYVTEIEGFRNFCVQLLMGDSTDNIPGIVKLLKKDGREAEAKKLIYGKYIKKCEDFIVDKDEKESYNYIFDLYTQHGYGEKEVKEIFNLCWLRRYEGQDGYEDFINDYNS